VQPFAPAYLYKREVHSGVQGNKYLPVFPAFLKNPEVYPGFHLSL
jgi:hypothetical protein